MKILIIQTAFIGDVILATPLIEKLHEFFPDATIDFLLRKGNESLLENHPYLNRILIFDKKKHRYGHLLQLIKIVRAESYDRVINVQRFFSSGLIAVFSGAGEIVGFDKNPWSFFYTKKVVHHISAGAGSKHEVSRNLSLIAGFTDAEMTLPRLYPLDKDFQKVNPEGDYICIAPASVWFTKQFPAHKWIELIDALKDKYTIYLMGGKEDLALCTQIQQQSGSEKIEMVAGQLTFLESAALMKNARMNFVNDSAPLHLASSVNAPVTAIFCSTVPGFGFGPLSDVSHIIETGHKLSCRPCGLHGKAKCPEGHFKCAEIEISKIISTALPGMAN